MSHKCKGVSMVMIGGLLVCCALLLPVRAASAQRQGAGPGGPDIQNVEIAWELQSKGVAQELALSPELTAKLVDAYKSARQSHMKALQSLMGQPGADRRDMSAMRKLTAAERVKFEGALKDFLTPEQGTKALASLGGFNRRWDRLVAALDAMKLDDAAKAKAMSMVAAYAAESDKAMAAAAGGDDWAAARENMTKLREKLDSDLAGVLSAEQMVQWKKATAMRGRGGEGRRQASPEPAPAPAPDPAK